MMLNKFFYYFFSFFYIIGTIAGAAVTAIMVNTMKKPISELKEAIEAEKKEEELELELDFD